MRRNGFLYRLLPAGLETEFRAREKRLRLVYAHTSRTKLETVLLPFCAAGLLAVLLTNGFPQQELTVGHAQAACGVAHGGVDAADAHDGGAYDGEQCIKNQCNDGGARADAADERER